jgi:hypothetical protein
VEQPLGYPTQQKQLTHAELTNSEFVNCAEVKIDSNLKLNTENDEGQTVASNAYPCQNQPKVQAIHKGKATHRDQTAVSLVKLMTTAEQPRNSYQSMNRSKLINEPDIKSVKQHHPRQLINLTKNG